MAKGMYVGINNVARKITKAYVGAGGVARKVKKGYIGVNGVPRLFFTSEASYVGTLTPLQEGRYRMQGWANANYALFMGGATASTNFSKVDAYDSNFTKSIPTGVADSDFGVNNNVGGAIGNYAFYAPLTNNASYITAYDTSLTRTLVGWNSTPGADRGDSIGTAYYAYTALGSIQYTSFRSRRIDSNLVIIQALLMEKDMFEM